jgi:hypothetical protein
MSKSGQVRDGTRAASERRGRARDGTTEPANTEDLGRPPQHRDGLRIYRIAQPGSHWDKQQPIILENRQAEIEKKCINDDSY